MRITRPALWTSLLLLTACSNDVLFEALEPASFEDPDGALDSEDATSAPDAPDLEDAQDDGAPDVPLDAPDAPPEDEDASIEDAPEGEVEETPAPFPGPCIIDTYRSGAIIQRITFTYAELRPVVLDIDNNADGSIEARIVIQYVDGLRVLDQHDQNNDGRVDLQQIYHYDENRRVTQVDSDQLADNLPETTYQYSYDGQGRLSFVDVVSPSINTIVKRQIYGYGENWTTEEHYEVITGQLGRMVLRRESSLDPQGRTYLTRTDHDGNGTTDELITYARDGLGNLTTATIDGAIHGNLPYTQQFTYDCWPR